MLTGCTTVHCFFLLNCDFLQLVSFSQECRWPGITVWPDSAGSVRIPSPILGQCVRFSQGVWWEQSLITFISQSLFLFGTLVSCKWGSVKHAMLHEIRIIAVLSFMLLAVRNVWKTSELLLEIQTDQEPEKCFRYALTTFVCACVCAGADYIHAASGSGSEIHGSSGAGTPLGHCEYLMMIQLCRGKQPVALLTLNHIYCTWVTSK